MLRKGFSEEVSVKAEKEPAERRTEGMSVPSRRNSRSKIICVTKWTRLIFLASFDNRYEVHMCQILQAWQ